ncbi:MAG: cell division protein FtsZ [Oscillospiraceae bacterium]|nr:cell division protein FtsZ [Ruminococcus sp.]MCD8345184.1 cell division protein FtsZ [Oscillospiraceae bacterium]
MGFIMENEGIDLAKIKVVGVGGGGGNALNCIVATGIQNVEYISINTDAQALKNSKATSKIQIGQKLTHGLGAGGKPEVGEAAAQESKDEIQDALKGADMIFITAGMGGGTGTGAAPVVAEIARDMGILTVAVVTKPFAFEGKRKAAQADRGIDALVKNVDSLVVIPNQKLLTGRENLTMRQSFGLADDILKTAVLSVTELILRHGEINVDFADVKSIMSNAGYAHMAIGHGEGKDKVADAVQQVISSPLLETSIKGAKRLLINITMSEDIGTGDIAELTDTITKAAAEDVDLIFGADFKEDLSDTIDIIVIASDFDTYSVPEEESDEPSTEDKPEESKPQTSENETIYDGIWRELFK